MRIRLILQARTSSSRLPAKVLLPLAGLPLAVLCAKRLARDGLEVVLATSTHPSDDLLCEMAREYGLAVHRGPLDDVLMRFVECAKDLADGDLIVRLTADNPVPDAAFVRLLLQSWKTSTVQYLGTASPIDGLPYGLSAEVFTVAALRAAEYGAANAHDREHVTSWIRKHLSCAIFDGCSVLGEGGLERLRCTIDTADDYHHAIALFQAIGGDPVSIDWRLLVDTLKGMPFSPVFRAPYRLSPQGIESRICLGTAQLGMTYGVTNSIGIPEEQASVELLREAIKHGVSWIDTAAAYGLAETRIGKALPAAEDGVRIVTKLSPLDELSAKSSSEFVNAAVDASVFRSLHALRRDRLDVVLLHRWTHRTAYGGVIWQRLNELKSEGVISELGASVYTPTEALLALDDPGVTHIQLPFNLLDHRWRSREFKESVARRADVRIHVRSVFLQGLLLHSGNYWPVWERHAQQWVYRLDRLVSELGRESKADLCLAYVLAQPWVDAAVLGVETSAQLIETLRMSCNRPLYADEIVVVDETLDGASERLLNPSKW